MGLLNPSEIIKEITKPSIKNKIPINSYEGYIRQLFWRDTNYTAIVILIFQNIIISKIIN